MLSPFLLSLTKRLLMPYDKRRQVSVEIPQSSLVKRELQRGQDCWQRPVTKICGSSLDSIVTAVSSSLQPRGRPIRRSIATLLARLREAVLAGTRTSTNGIGRLRMADCVLQTLIPDIERLAETKVAKYKLPGMALGIIRDQELVWFGGFGAADLDSGKKPTENAIARIASVTKTFTTTAIMQLRDEGRLKLEDPLAQHMPEFAAVRAIRGDIEGVTLRRLLTHRSGLVTESPTHGWNDLDFPSREEMIAKLPETGIVIPQDSRLPNTQTSHLGYSARWCTGSPVCPTPNTSTPILLSRLV